MEAYVVLTNGRSGVDEWAQMGEAQCHELCPGN